MQELTNFEYSTYALDAHSEGAILRAELRGKWVYSLLHVWPKLGDPNLKQALTELRNESTKSELVRIAQQRFYQNEELEWSLQQSQNFLPSHLQISIDPLPELSSLQKLGFLLLKVKVKQAIDYWTVHDAHLKFPHFRWRLDFNNGQSPEELDALLAKSTEAFLDAIDFIEDPFTYSSHWSRLSKKHSVRFAGDFSKSPRPDPSLCEGMDVLVLKASRENLDSWVKFAHQNMKRVVMTHYLQHPLGQFFDFFAAVKQHLEHPLVMDPCGFASYATSEQKLWTLRDGLVCSSPNLSIHALIRDTKWQKL